ncbi:hypothetical protein SADUNF_Sadunf08G0125000 [Salix dunnii]|uniref:DUF7615 domain-containing protein n=1 Tax=Salix dunnii TaxID=1413687 RepID=A0A835K0A1_9ROSI|nr:hypothetical protein SADUNF_Sadunf08G0125000 [Salix dunnii]
MHLPGKGLETSFAVPGCSRYMVLSKSNSVKIIPGFAPPVLIMAEGDRNEPINEQVVANMYTAMRTELNQIYSKITELEMDVSEHSLVINAIQPLDPSRRCYRMIGGVLVERTIKEVLPAVLRNKEGIEEVIARLNEAAERKKKEISDFEAKYKIRIRKSDSEVKDDTNKKEGSSQGVLVGPAAVNVMLEVNNHQDLLKPRTSSPDVSLSTDRQTETLKLEDEINQILQALRVSQDAKTFTSICTKRVLNWQVTRQKPSLMLCCIAQVDQIKREMRKLTNMEEVANGFGRTSKDVHKEHFGNGVKGLSEMGLESLPSNISNPPRKECVTKSCPKNPFPSLACQNGMTLKFLKLSVKLQRNRDSFRIINHEYPLKYLRMLRKQLISSSGYQLMRRGKYPKQLSPNNIFFSVSDQMLEYMKRSEIVISKATGSANEESECDRDRRDKKNPS